MQQPTSEEGALIKRNGGKFGIKTTLPTVISSLCRSMPPKKPNNRADYNALTTWGVFFNEETNNFSIILLNAIKKRMEYPELKKLVLSKSTRSGSQMRSWWRRNPTDRHCIKSLDAWGARGRVYSGQRAGQNSAGKRGIRLICVRHRVGT
jgi:hypothetical protein